jgi:hypothetical protein
MTTITYPASTGVACATYTVYLRAKWGDPWVQTDDLQLLQLTLATGETISHALFRYRFGREMASLTVKPVIAINPLCYVKVTVHGTAGRPSYTWFGLWRAARKSDVDQVFSAVGIEALLDQPCLDMPWLDSGGDVQWAGRGLEFNANGRPNRSAATHTVGSDTCYVFEPDESVAEYWSTRDAIGVILAMAAPEDEAGNILWQWLMVYEAQLPDFDQVRITTHGRTWASLLRSLVSRYRLTGWKTFCWNDDDVAIHFFTFADAAFTLYDADSNAVGTVPANLDQVALNVAADASGAAALTVEASAVVDQVIATGAQRTITFSISAPDLSLTNLWDAADATAYWAGASGSPDYPPATEPAARDEMNRAVRNGDALRHVFARFGPPAAWQQLAGDGEMGHAVSAIAYEEDGLTQRWLYPPALVFLEHLPLRFGWSYDGSKIEDGDSPHYGEEGPAPTYDLLPPLVFLKTTAAAGGASARWTQGDQLGRGGKLPPKDDEVDRVWSTEVRALRDQLAVEVRVHGEDQHVLAATESAGLTDEIPGSLKWEELILTVCVRDPWPVEVKYPADADVTPLGDQVRKLRIECPQYNLAEVRPYTVVGVDDSGQLLRSDGGNVTDDSDLLAMVAQRAYAWHKTWRYALQLRTAWVDGNLLIGQLITTLTDATGTYPVKSVVTEITIEFPVASGAVPPAPRCSVVTAFGELDAAATM